MWMIPLNIEHGPKWDSEMNDTLKSYPLAWPAGWKRTLAQHRVRARFNKNRQEVSIAEGTGRVLKALDLLGVRDWNIIISSNLLLRNDGLPRSGQPAPVDPGVAVYWRKTDKDLHKVMAIDQYDRVADNLAAIAATLEAMRAIERYGGAQILDRAFTGFLALPAPKDWREWRAILQLDGNLTLEMAERHYKKLRLVYHPDKPTGSHEQMTELNRAWAEAQEALQ